MDHSSHHDNCLYDDIVLYALLDPHWQTVILLVLCHVMKFKITHRNVRISLHTQPLYNSQQSIVLSLTNSCMGGK